MTPVEEHRTDPPELLTVGEVAQRFAVSDETIHRWARKGRIPFICLPSGLKRFRRDDIEAILRGKLPGSAA